MEDTALISINDGHSISAQQFDYPKISEYQSNTEEIMNVNYDSIFSDATNKNLNRQSLKASPSQ